MAPETHPTFDSISYLGLNYYVKNAHQSHAHFWDGVRYVMLSTWNQTRDGRVNLTKYVLSIMRFL